MKITFITLFPEIFPAFLNFSILKRAQQKGIIEFEVLDLRQFGVGTRRSVDDRPYGGGTGMILKPDVLAKALDYVVDKLKIKNSKCKVILTAASGKTFNQQKAKEFSKLENLVLICGHYEGVDQRFIDRYIDEEVSIGDYILTGGELPSLVIADSITRLLPGVLEKEETTMDESFENNLLEYPHFTRPEIFEGFKVPDVLVSGNHKEIKNWRTQKALEKTKQKRPGLLRD